MATVSERVGLWQVMLLLLLGCNYIIVGINHTLPTFQGYTPHFFCQADNVSARVEGCVPVHNMQNEPSCPQGYQFESDRGDWTVVTEWQLVCERRYLRSLIATLYFCGVTIGAIVCGLQADRYGRRPVMLICLYAQGLLGVSLYFAPTFEAFMALRFIQGFFVQGLQGTTYTLLVELFPTRFRTAVGVALELYWALGLMYLSGASYYVPNWHPLELVLSIPTAATLLYVCLVPESKLWLAVHGRVEVWERWKRILSCNRRQKSNDTNSIKNRTSTLKCTEYASGPLSQNTKNQHIVQNDIIQNEINSIPIDSFNFGHPDTGTQLMAHSGEERKGVMKEKLVGLQSTSEITDKTRAQYDQNQGKMFTVDDKNLGTSQVSSIIMLRENYGMVNESETEIRADVTEDRESINDVVHDGTMKLITSGTDMSNDDEVICSNVAKKLGIVENRTVAGTQKIMATTTKRPGFFELFRNPVLRKYNLIMVFVWFSVSLLYYGIMFHLPDLSGERHLNFFLGAVVEVISYVLAYIILSRFGRRLPMASFLLISGIICIAVGTVSAVPGKDAYWIGATVTALALIGKGVAVSGFCTMFLYASELFPTVLRGVAMGHCGFWGRVGSLLAPQLLFLGEYTLPPVPLVIIGVLGMLAGLSVLLLPETLGQKLPDTVEEAEIWARN